MDQSVSSQVQKWKGDDNVSEADENRQLEKVVLELR